MGIIVSRAHCPAAETEARRRDLRGGTNLWAGDSGLHRPAGASAAAGPGQEAGAAGCPLPSSAEPPPGPGQGPGRRGNRPDTDPSPAANRAAARLRSRPGPRRGRGQRVRPPGAVSLPGSAGVGTRGARVSAQRGGAQPPGAAPARPGLGCRGAPGAPHTRAPGIGRAGPGLRPHLHRPSEEDARVRGQLLHVEVHGAHGGPRRPQRSLAPPARRRRPAPRPPAAGAPALALGEPSPPPPPRSQPERAGRGAGGAGGASGPAGRGGAGRAAGLALRAAVPAAFSRRLAGLSGSSSLGPAPIGVSISLCPFACPWSARPSVSFALSLCAAHYLHLHLHHHLDLSSAFLLRP